MTGMQSAKFRIWEILYENDYFFIINEHEIKQGIVID